MNNSLFLMLCLCLAIQAKAATSVVTTSGVSAKSLSPNAALTGSAPASADTQTAPIQTLVSVKPRVAAEQASDIWFNPALLSEEVGSVADLSTFQNRQQLPGVYLVDIYLNNAFIEARDLAFVARASGDVGEDGTGLVPALTLRDLANLGVKMDLLPGQQEDKAVGEERAPLADPGRVVDLEAVIAASTTRFDFNHQRLDITIPQASLERRALGEVPEHLWDEGVNALLLSYQFTGSQNSGDAATENSHFLGLNSGLNIGSWRLRDSSSWNKSGDTDEWQHINTTLSRAIIPLKSELVMGDSSTPSNVFDGVSFRGMQLVSDDSMYPDSQQGYAPTVRGVAKSNAKVTIKQGTTVLYQTNVSPGPFIIDDMFSTYDNGDLRVEIEESDGSITHYDVPYSSVPNMLREGRTQYGLTVGRYRSANDEQNEPLFVQGSLVMGMADGFTLFGGTQLSEDYRSVAFGVSKNMGDWGGVSADLTHARTTLPDGNDVKGQSLRLLYSKSLNDYGTDLELMNARYSTEEFYSFADSTYKSMSGFYTPENVDPDSPDWAYQYDLNYAKRGRMVVKLNQDMEDLGSLYFNLSKQTYWNTDDSDSLAQFGYSGSWGDVVYNLAYNYSKSQFQPDGDQILSLSLSMPIGSALLGDPQSSMYASYNSSYDDEGNSVHNVGLSGVALEDKSLHYSVQQGYETQDKSTTGSASLRYTGGRGNASIGYNYGEGHQQVNYGLSGGVVAHSEGVTFSQPLGDTNILVAAPGAAGADVRNGQGNHTDWRGYTVVPHGTVYRNNRVELDVNSLGANVDLDQTVSNVVPTKGALVKADFTARVGVRALLTLTHAGKPVPFGAQVSESANQGSGIVSDDGVVYLSGLPLSGTLEVSWGAKSGQSCTVDYTLPEESLAQSITKAALTCH